MATILIVEDESVMSDVQKEVFARAEISCDVAENGIKAVSHLKQKNYDAIVMDIIMPRMDGFQLLKIIAKHSQWKLIPVIILSNLSQISDRQQCEKLGACSYLLKTQTSLDKLVEEVKKRLK